MAKYIIKVRFYSHSEFVSGGSYVFKGEKYATFGYRDTAKRYKSRKIAENAMKKLQASCVNMDGNAEILEVKE